MRQVPPLDERGREHDGAQRPPAPLGAGEHAVDQQAERALELRARGRLGQLEHLLQALGGRARAQRRVLAAREVARERAGLAEAVGQRGPRELREVAERGDAEPLQRLGERGDLGPRGEQRHRQRGEIGGEARRRVRGDLRPARAGAMGGGERGEARGRGADPRAAPRERGLPRDGAARPPGARAWRVVAITVSTVPPCRRRRPRSSNQAVPGRSRLDRGADALQGADDSLPGVGHAGRVGRHQAQRRAAGQCLPQAQAGADAVGLGGGGGLADQRLAADLRRQCERAGGQGLAAAGGDGELEAREMDADDHEGEHTFAYPSGGAQRTRRAEDRRGPGFPGPLP